MADTAHRLTDEKLEEIEKRLSAIYSRAEKKSGNVGKNILQKLNPKLTRTPDGEGGTLYKCVQARTSQSDWMPSATPALWKTVSVD